MKKVLMPAIAFLLFTTACEKNAIPSPTSPVVNTNNSVHSNSRMGLDFNYTCYIDPITNKGSCPRPKNDCAIVVSSTSAFSFTPIDDAIKQGKVQSFFNQANWADLFPFLDEQPNVVAGLQRGDYTMVKQTNSAGETLYIVLSSTENQDAIRSTIYTTLIPAQ